MDESCNIINMQCNYCEKNDGTCGRAYCNCCGKCEGILFDFGEDLEFALCVECFKKIQSKLSAGDFVTVVQDEIGSGISEISEKIIVTRKTITEQERTTIFERDNYQCVQCGSTERLEIDHIIPFSKGGTTEMDNLQTLCRKCNGKKSNTLPYGNCHTALQVVEVKEGRL